MARRSLFIVVAMGCCIAGSFLAPPWVAIPLTVIAVGVLPGAAVTNALLGRHRDYAEAAVSSVGLSLAIAVLGAVLLGTTVGITRVSVACLLGSVTVVGAGLDLVSTRRTHFTDVPGPRSIRTHILGASIAVIVSVAAVAAVAWSLSYARTPLHARVRGYTVLWMVPKGADFIVGVRSQELHATQYRLVVSDGSRHVRHWRIDLLPGGRWGPVTGKVPDVGSAKAMLYVRRDGNWIGYRHVRVPGYVNRT